MKRPAAQMKKPAVAPRNRNKGSKNKKPPAQEISPADEELLLQHERDLDEATLRDVAQVFAHGLVELQQDDDDDGEEGLVEIEVETADFDEEEMQEDSESGMSHAPADACPVF